MGTFFTKQEVLSVDKSFHLTYKEVMVLYMSDLELPKYDLLNNRSDIDILINMIVIKVMYFKLVKDKAHVKKWSDMYKCIIKLKDGELCDIKSHISLNDYIDVSLNYDRNIEYIINNSDEDSDEEFINKYNKKCIVDIDSCITSQV